jgi:hypothetical protein
MQRKKAILCFFAVWLALVATVVFGAPAPVKKTQTSLSKDGSVTNQSGGGVASPINCFAYFKPGTVVIGLSASKADYKVGDEIKLSAKVTNANSFPIAQGNLFVQIYRQALDSKAPDFLVDEFFVQDMALNARETRNVEFAWRPPSGISGGKYIVGGFFVINKNIYVSGAPFNERAYDRASVSFNLRSIDDASEIIVEKQNISFNGQKYNYFGIIPEVKAGQPVEIVSSLKNLSNKSQEVKVSKKIYMWDNLREENVVQKESEKVTLNAGGGLNLYYSSRGLNSGSYLYELIIESQSGVKSIAKVRFQVSGDKPSAHVKFLALSNWPLRNGDNAYIFNCFESLVPKGSEGKVYLTLRDGADNSVLQRVEYSGPIEYSPIAIKNDFKADKERFNLILEAQIYDRQGNLLDQESIKYDCSSFDNEVREVKIEVDEKNDTIKAFGANSCGSAVNGKISLEVIKISGASKKVFLEKDYSGEEMVKNISLKGGQTYKITAKINSVLRSIEYKSTKPNYDWLWWVIGLAVIFLIIFIFVKRQMDRAAVAEPSFHQADFKQ